MYTYVGNSQLEYIFRKTIHDIDILIKNFVPFRTIYKHIYIRRGLRLHMIEKHIDRCLGYKGCQRTLYSFFQKVKSQDFQKL